MGLHYFIDGNNLLHSTARWDHLPWQNRRVQLLHSLAEERPMGSERNALTVVFDGHGPRLKLAGAASVEAVFSGDLDADTVIIERVAALKNPREAVVVTNDKAIRLHVREKRAAVLSCEEFLEKGKKKAGPRLSGKSSSTETDSINAEFKKLWRLE